MNTECSDEVKLLKVEFRIRVFVLFEVDVNPEWRRPSVKVILIQHTLRSPDMHICIINYDKRNKTTLESDIFYQRHQFL